MKKEKTDFSFKAFKKFLTDSCWDEKLYGDGKYDRKIYNWFELGKPKKIEFYEKNGDKIRFKKGN